MLRLIGEALRISGLIENKKFSFLTKTPFLMSIKISGFNNNSLYGVLIPCRLAFKPTFNSQKTYVTLAALAVNPLN